MLISAFRSALLLSVLVCLSSWVSLSSASNIGLSTVDQGPKRFVQRSAVAFQNVYNLAKRMEGPSSSASAPSTSRPRSEPSNFEKYSRHTFSRPPNAPPVSEEEKEQLYERHLREIHVDGKPILYADEIRDVDHFHAPLRAYGGVYLVDKRPPNRLPAVHGDFDHATLLSYSNERVGGVKDKVFSLVSEFQNTVRDHGADIAALRFGPPFKQDPGMSNHDLFKHLGLEKKPNWKKVAKTTKPYYHVGAKDLLDLRRFLNNNRKLVMSNGNTYHGFVLNKHGKLFYDDITRYIRPR